MTYTWRNKLPECGFHHNLNVIERFHYDRLKATEFRQFLLYSGPIVLRNVVPNSVYTHFLTLTVAMSILLNSNEKKREHYLQSAKELLAFFVKQCDDVSGPTFNVYNVHSLAHVADDVQHFGCSLNGS